VAIIYAEDALWRFRIIIKIRIGLSINAKNAILKMRFISRLLMRIIKFRSNST
jgi:hypothetical protein